MRSLVCRTVSCIACVVLVLLSPGYLFAASPISIAGTADQVLPEADDFAKTVLGDPWDMNEITDIRKERSFNLTGFSVSGGVLSAISGVDSNLNNTSKNPSNPQIYLLYPGYLGSQEIGKLGVNYPVNANYYRQLSFRMYLDQALPGDVAGVYWATDEAFAHYGYAIKIPVYSGWHTYVLDLADLNLDAGDTPWGGTIRALRLDPISRSGVTIRLDWVRLTPLDSSKTRQTIGWPAGDPAARVNLYSSLDNTDPSSSGRYAPIGSTTAGAGTYSWGTSALPPGRYYVRSETGYDWATMMRGNTWDMSETGGDVDIYTSGDFAPQYTGVPSFSGGVLSGTTMGTGDVQSPSIFLAFSPYTPISGSDFYVLTLRLNKPSGYAFMISWATTDSPIWYSYWVGDPTGGWNTYTLDMRSAPAGNPWTGKQIWYLRIDPVRSFASYGTTIHPGIPWQVDWVGLTGGGPTPTTETDLTSSVSFASGTVTVNDAPYLSVTRPSMTSGPDYAATELGNAWDMNSVGDVPSLSGIQGIITHGQRDPSCNEYGHDDTGAYSFAAGVLSATTYGTPCPDSQGVMGSDDQLWLNTGVIANLTDHPIDTSKYKYATYSLYQEGSQDTTGGWVSRIIWWTGLTGTTGDLNLSITKDIVIDEGWNTYTVDLSKATLDVSGDYGWKQYAKFFRFDPNEIPSSTKFHLARVLLTGDDVAGDSFPITWNAGGDSEATVSLYWSLGNGGSGLHPIATGLSASNGTYSWDTTTVRGSSNTTAKVYIYAVTQDSYNSSTAVSKAPVVVALDSSYVTRLYLPVILKSFAGGW